MPGRALWWMAQGLFGGNHKAGEAGKPADWEGGGRDCEAAAAKSGNSAGER